MDQQKRITKSKFIGSLVSPIIASALLLFALLIPPAKWVRPPIIDSVGPLNYDVSLNAAPQIIDWPKGQSLRPEKVVLKFAYKVFSWPAEYAVLLSTSPYIDHGIQISIDKWGNVFLSIQSASEVIHVQSDGQTVFGFHLVKISETQELGIFSKVLVSIDLNSGLFEISINGRLKPTVDPRPDRLISINDFILENNDIRLGGSESHVFPGEI